MCFSVIKVDIRSEEGEADANIFTPEFEPRQHRPRQVTTRPVKPDAEPEYEDLPPPAAAAQASTGKSGKREGQPIFLRRRWLASDGGA